MIGKPDRRWFQFHLSTMVLALFTLAFAFSSIFGDSRILMRKRGNEVVAFVQEMGYPFPSYRIVERSWICDTAEDASPRGMTRITKYSDYLHEYDKNFEHFSADEAWLIKGIGLNVLFFSAILGMIGFVFRKLSRTWRANDGPKMNLNEKHFLQ